VVSGTRTTLSTAAERTRQPPRRIKESRIDLVFLIAVYVLLAVAVIIVVAPLLHILSSSFSSPEAVSSGQVLLWPVDFSIQGYQAVMANPQILTGYGNSLFYTVAGTVISTALTVAIAYPLSRKNFMGRNVIMVLVLFTMLFSGGLIPTYLVVQELGMLNTRWSLLIPNAIAVWQVIIARTYFQSAIPNELTEAAELDGCGDLRFLWSVVLPLSKPMIAVVALMYAIAQWNSYFDALIYLKDADLYPLQLVLRNILILNTQSTIADPALQMERQRLADLLKYSLIVVASIPVLLIYPFVARHFTKGVLVGAIKG
jgi:putative aldouronate transport system permease protein